MATLAQAAPGSQRRSDWLWEFLKQELAPDPGRAKTVARMVIAATLVMVIGMTFRVPYTFQGAIYALMISRETTRATLQSAATIFTVTGIGAAYLLISAWFVINVPLLHLLWFIGTLFLSFFVISALKNYTATLIFAIMIAVGAPLWDRHVSAETNVEDTLWLCLATLIGIVVTAGVELAFARLRPGDEVGSQITERLWAVQNLLTDYAEGRAVDPDIEKKIIRFEILGTSLLRRILRRSDYSPQYSADMGGAAALVGRLVDLAATLTQLSVKSSTIAQKRFHELASTLASIRNDLMNRKIPGPVEFQPDEESSDVPLLGEMEQTVTLITQVFAGSRSIHEYVPSEDDVPRPAVLVPDALFNPQHLQFALKGCLAASSCYFIYNAIAWPGISTAVTTCLLTALSTIGASRQKQILRIMGAIAGGFLLGMGSQIFILPGLDSIAGFMVLFVLVTALSAWFMTSSPRLSYFGMQVAVAFYLINLEEFKIQISLAVARDRVVGILLGLFMMWFVFDRLWGAPAGVEMKRAFVSSFRLLGQLAREPLSKDVRVAIKDTLALREKINAHFDQVRALADGVLFEFGPSRRHDLAMRGRIRQWQPPLRTLFLLRIASLKYRLQLPGFELPEAMRAYQREYDERSARMLEDMADAIEGKRSDVRITAQDSAELLRRVVEECCGLESQRLPVVRVDSFITLLREIDQLTASLAKEIEMEFRPVTTVSSR
jgi:multidrug resistance protein MdtO